LLQVIDTSRFDLVFTTSETPPTARVSRRVRVGFASLTCKTSNEFSPHAISPARRYSVITSRTTGAESIHVLYVY